MANKPKKSDERDRRAKIEAMRKAEAARQRRRSIAFVAIAVVVGLGLIAAVAVPAYIDNQNDPANKDVASFGVAADRADCDDVETAEGTADVNNHVEAGTKVEYETVPPSYGPHWPQPVFPARSFYTERDRPQMEQLVHNLEHGYTVLWYDPDFTAPERKMLEDIAISAREMDEVGPNQKFIVSAWDDSYGDFPDDKRIGLAHWGAQDSAIQLCGQISGEVVKQFVQDHPASDAPEPNAQ